MFNVEFTKSFVKDFKKIDQAAKRQFLEKWIPKLEQNPEIGGHFVGKNLKGFRKLKFRAKRSDFRVVYKINKRKVTILMIAIGTRENFYKSLNK